MEINASDDRSGATLQGRILDAVEMQSVMGQVGAVVWARVGGEWDARCRGDAERDGAWGGCSGLGWGVWSGINAVGGSWEVGCDWVGGWGVGP